MPSMPAAPLLRFTCANACLRFSPSTIASIDGPATAGRSRQAFAARASIAPATTLGASPLASLLHFSSRSFFCGMAPPRSPPHCPRPPFGPPAARRRLLCPRLTAAPRSDRLATPPVPRDTAQPSRGKPDRLRHTPAGSTTPTLDGRGLRDHWLPRPAG